MITKQIFLEATGRVPVDDDLERCNCQNAGEGHYFCGWNHDMNRPAFFGGLDPQKVKTCFYKVELNK